MNKKEHINQNKYNMRVMSMNKSPMINTEQKYKGGKIQQVRSNEIKQYYIMRQ